MEDLITLDKEYVANTYGRFPVALVKGKGSEFWDVNGKRYIDMGSGIGVTSFGTGDEVWVQAVTAQLGQLQHTSNLYYTEPCIRLAKLLCEKTGMGKVFFSNSGAEANECAIKVARRYSQLKKGEGHHVILTLENSFHGRTLTTLAATGQTHYHELFQPLTPGFAHVPANDIAALEKAVETLPLAGVLMECVQGEGGVVPLTEEFIRTAAKLCQQKDIPLMIDEVQTGNGRTGKLYAYMHYGITPDLVSTAKGLGGGLPIGATLMSKKVENALTFGDHGSTYGANPVCCAGALSVIQRLDDAFLARVAEKSRYVFSQLTNAKGVKAVTGLGLMVGIATQRSAGDVVKACMARGVLCLTAKDKVRLLPSLNIPMALLQEAVAIIKEECAREDV